MPPGVVSLPNGFRTLGRHIARQRQGLRLEVLEQQIEVPSRRSCDGLCCSIASILSCHAARFNRSDADEISCMGSRKTGSSRYYDGVPGLPN